ncbi:hypothetical protein Bhyg_13190 [Pseudolycoriella hygida]|uniref:Uncharacterized protein n=1 Tax=Pseudolycoriella hygida TaxID=35572 RepID=A0A9Q0RUG7_9DIPT|nr:hypothetical protein Bhyg_13190 [Pseudolycoriella hygida]
MLDKIIAGMGSSCFVKPDYWSIRRTGHHHWYAAKPRLVKHACHECLQHSYIATHQREAQKCAETTICSEEIVCLIFFEVDRKKVLKSISFIVITFQKQKLFGTQRRGYTIVNAEVAASVESRNINRTQRDLRESSNRRNTCKEFIYL